jgi:basic amino acid/polyamine antiporter, APA family
MSQSETAEPRTELGLWDAISIIVGIVIGASIFKIPWLIFAHTSDPWTGLAVWAVGGVLALVGALCYAELATTYPRSGGDYVYLTYAFGPWCGFLFGWAQLAVVLTASIGAMAYVFADFATGLQEITVGKDFGITSEFIYATLAVVVLSALNIVGVTLGKTAQNLLTLAKLLGIIGIIVAGFGWAESSPGEWQPAETGVGWQALAIILVLYAYGGWNDAAFVAAEVRDPRRNIPRALILGVGLIMVIYLLVNAAYLTGLGFDKARQPGRLPALLLEKPLGEFGGRAMSLLVMVSALGAVNGLIFTGARVYATLGNDHPIFTWLGHWKPGRGAPTFALATQLVIALGMIFAFGSETGQRGVNALLGAAGIPAEETWTADRAFDALVAHTAPVFWAFFLMTGIALFVLRARDPNRPRPFPVPVFPVFPAIFCLMCVYMLYQSTIYVGWRALFAAGLVLLGLPLYAISRMIGYRGEATPSLEPGPPAPALDTRIQALDTRIKE